MPRCGRDGRRDQVGAGATTRCCAQKRRPINLPDRLRGNPEIRHFCKACMDGNYPTGDVTEATLEDIESERLKAQKEMEASG